MILPVQRFDWDYINIVRLILNGNCRWNVFLKHIFKRISINKCNTFCEPIKVDYISSSEIIFGEM